MRPTALSFVVYIFTAASAIAAQQPDAVHAPQPVVVEVRPPGKIQVETRTEENEANEKRITDRSILWATIALFLATATLAEYTRRLWRDTARVARDTKQIAETQVAATAAIERAYLFVEVELREQLRSSPSGFPNIVQVTIRNHGKTPAEIVQLRGYAQIAETPPTELLEFPGSSATLPAGYAIAQNDSYPLPVTARITNQEMGDLETLTQSLFIVGLVRYKDIFRTERETGFCWFYQHHMQHGAFLINPDSALNRRT